jgi:hypothetical protein
MSVHKRCTDCKNITKCSEKRGNTCEPYDNNRERSVDKFVGDPRDFKRDGWSRRSQNTNKKLSKRKTKRKSTR